VQRVVERLRHVKKILAPVITSIDIGSSQFLRQPHQRLRGISATPPPTAVS